MRPKWLPEAEYRGFVAEAQSVLPVDDGPTVQLIAAGLWLQRTMAAEGASHPAVKNLAFAFGQAAASRDTWATATAMLARWRAGRAPTAGVEWALELLEGDVSDLPPGGLCMTREARSA